MILACTVKLISKLARQQDAVRSAFMEPRNFPSSASIHRTKKQNNNEFPAQLQSAGCHHEPTSMKLIGTFALISLCGGLTNCSPVYSVERYGVKATLIDAVSKQPIVRTGTRIVVDGAAFKRDSDNRGAISLRPDRRLHWSWLGGPIWMNDPETAIEIGPSGYQPLRIKWQPHLPAKTAGAEIPRFSEDGGIVDLGGLEMKKR